MILARPIATTTARRLPYGPPGRGPAMAEQRWKFWGWGLRGQRARAGRAAAAVRVLSATGSASGRRRAGRRPTVDEIALRAPRLRPPSRLESLCTSEPYERLLHSYGKSFPEAVRIFARDFKNAPDLVAKPRSEDDVSALLDWAAEARAAVIPFGGGSSVVGGVEPRRRRKTLPARSASISRGWTGCSRSTARAGPRASRAACSGRRSRRRSSRRR